MTIEDEALTDGDIATAGVQWVAALVGRLVEKGLITTQDAQSIASEAREQCRAEGVAKAARVIAALSEEGELRG
ncbi:MULTISPECIES: hypothetical protein [Sphingobium]|jgi:hypothetical protein|uniref:Uncharacterized protein n=2 Tax=Sphingobium fuliginis (strain ATCC 27551) TaxID=336203 RepID=A0A292ZBA9_SPHSA|nr:MULTISPECIES: hypothetical protein [Sphingobium]OAP32630.1 hypothetical protein A8O16_06975 [Sphingobium sp. 20006FA]KXU31061.1 hypothetical protein AXW74_14495 [Sphingobium sp. AM]KYC33448.1 hypothetical protein A0J57_04855 [Sphingobium sp. 22B]MCB4859451.1 hypothetical protein [Sphingobium sp. PNB]PNQ03148.1 hypothetical protein A8G00_12980 [Sphingobium sp. SA916]